MDGSFWSGRKVLITGHTGFKGSWLSIWLNTLGAQVSGLALPPDPSSLFSLANVEELVNSVYVDIRDLNAVQTALVKIQPEIVIHLAAQPLVRESYLNPIETLETNIMGTAHLLEAIRVIPSIRSFVNVTTDKVYENKEWVWGYRETDSLGGYDPYSVSKACSELITHAYRQSFFFHKDSHLGRVAIATARAGNVIGGGDAAKDRLVPDTITALRKHEEVILRNPHAVRPWQHVLDPLHGYLMLAEHLYKDGAKYAKSWNFGPLDNNAKTVQWVVEYLFQHWGSTHSIQVSEEENPHETHQLRLDCSQAIAELGWYPRWEIETSLDKILEWNRLVDDGASPRSVCVKQIQEYMQTEVKQI